MGSWWSTLLQIGVLISPGGFATPHRPPGRFLVSTS